MGGAACVSGSCCDIAANTEFHFHALLLQPGALQKPESKAAVASVGARFPHRVPSSTTLVRDHRDGIRPFKSLSLQPPLHQVRRLRKRGMDLLGGGVTSGLEDHNEKPRGGNR